MTYTYAYKTSDGRRHEDSMDAPSREAVFESLRARSIRPIKVVAASPEDGMEARQIKAMVEGMKAEARAYVAAGGNLVEYGRRLTERQDAEIAIYERAKADLEATRSSKSESDLVAYWEALNDRLRNLGIRLLPLE